MSNNNNLEAFLQNIIVASSDAELVSNTVLRQLKDLLRAVVIETFDQELKPLIEDLFRTVVQDVLESKLSVAQRNLEDHEIPITSNPRTLKLKFIEKAVSSPVYTGVEIKGEGGFPLRVALFDDITGNIVDSGPNASLEVEIVVLKVDYFRSPGGNDTWTAREFIDSIVRERETRNSLGRRSSSLLTERVLVKLDKGIGDVQNVKFRHTSSHMRNTQYRLGAHVTNLSRGTRIQEAMTDPFLVKDKHILRNVKYDTPSLSDDVWRLVNIGRRGPVYSHLKEQNVSTVEDLLILHLRDPILLKTTLCMKPSALEETLNNAKRCISNKVYCHTDSRRQHTGVVFNIFGQVLGLIRQSQYIPADDLSQDDKANAPQFLASAYEHWEEVECFDDPTSLVQKFPKLSSSTSCSNSCVEKMIGELLDPNTEFLIIDNGAGSSANDFGSTSCPWNIDEDAPTITRSCSDSLDSFSDEEFSKKIQELALGFQLSGDEYEDSDKEELVGDSRQAQYESSGSMFLENRKVFDPVEPPDWVEREESIEWKANRVDLPFSLRIIKRKKQWEEGFHEEGDYELASCSVKRAFSNMVFIIRELHSYTLQMREMLFYEDLQGVLVRVQKEMHASFVWLFQQVFSRTPTLMVYVMILLANYSVHSMAMAGSGAAPLPRQAYAAATEEAAVSVMEDQSNAKQKFDSSSIKTFSLSSSNGKSTSIGGSSGGGGKFRPTTGATDDDGGTFNWRLSSDYHQTIFPDTIGGEESVSGQVAWEEEFSRLWNSIEEEASRMQSELRDEALDHETMLRFVSPINAKIESEDFTDYFRTELLYQTGLAQEPNNTLLLANYAQFLFLIAQDYDRAEEYFKRAAAVEPKDAEALNKYATFLWQARNNLWAAEQTYQAAMDAEPNNPFYPANYAHFLWNTGGEDTCFPLDTPDAADNNA